MDILKEWNDVQGSTNIAGAMDGGRENSVSTE